MQGKAQVQCIPVTPSTPLPPFPSFLPSFPTPHPLPPRFISPVTTAPTAGCAERDRRPGPAPSFTSGYQCPPQTSRYNTPSLRTHTNSCDALPPPRHATASAKLDHRPCSRSEPPLFFPSRADNLCKLAERILRSTCGCSHRSHQPPIHPPSSASASAPSWHQTPAPATRYVSAPAKICFHLSGRGVQERHGIVGRDTRRP